MPVLVVQLVLGPVKPRHIVAELTGKFNGERGQTGRNGGSCFVGWRNMGKLHLHVHSPVIRSIITGGSKAVRYLRK